MKMQGKFGLATALLLVIPSFAQAQHSMGNFRAAPSVPMSARGAAPMPTPALHAGPARARTSNRASGGRVAKTTAAMSPVAANSSVGANNSGTFGFAGDPISVQQLLNPYPGFGFDFEHLNAINRDIDIKAFIDPATQARLAVAERLQRNFSGAGGGVILLDGGGAYYAPVDSGGDLNADQADAPQQGQQPGQQQAQQQGQQQPSQQQPIIIIQQPAGQQPAGQQSAGTRSAGASNGGQGAQEEPAPLRDVGQFTLVLLSGDQIETVAFTRAVDKIVYITSEGGRRTLAVSELDIDATVRLNQERGTPLQLPL
ncbi:MAG: hypothetical protein WB987_06915 [Candidatus Acidiferrales bacterium]